MDKNNIISKVIDAGLKITKPRIDIIFILEQHNGLLSAQDIYDKLRLKDVRVTLSTVYRSLEKLNRNNIINKVVLETDNQALYEYNRQVHHHHFLVCKMCNKIKTIYSCPLEEYEKELAKKTGFAITGHKIEFYGYCKECSRLL